MDIETDNQFHLNRFKLFPPHPSYIAGFIDGDGNLFIRKIKDGYQSGISIAQSRTNILQILRYHFGGNIVSNSLRNNKEDKINDDGTYYKFSQRNEYNLVIRNNEYHIILSYIKYCLIIKNIQYECLYNFNKIVNKVDLNEEKENLHNICKLNNIQTKIEEQKFNKLNFEYIAGLFDAEGCIFISKDYKKKYISISQKKYPIILHKINNLLKFGMVKKETTFDIYKKSDCLSFIKLIKPYLIVKYNQANAFETFITTDDIKIKEEMYKICNAEKHKVEQFNDLNKSDEGKEGFKYTLHLQDLKSKICSEIRLKQVYKEKSQKMMGEGNHNFGKHKSEETKKKMSLSIRDARGGVNDETILNVRQLIEKGRPNVEIQKILNLPRHTVSRIKNNIIVLRTENKTELQNQEENIKNSNIKRRKIKLNELCSVIEDIIIRNDKPSNILLKINTNRTTNNEELLGVDIIKNIKRHLQNNKLPIYKEELQQDKYNYFQTLLENYNK